MKRLLTVVMAGLLVAAFALPAFAWELTMTGEYEFRLRYLQRLGDVDLFGVAPLQDSDLTYAPQEAGAAIGQYGLHVGFAGPNWYNRGAAPANFLDTGAALTLVNPARIVRGGYSTYGNDALYSDSRFTLYPEFHVNPAIAVKAVCTVGGIRNKWFQNAGGTNPALQGVAATGAGLSAGTPPFERYYMSQSSMNAYDTAAIPSIEQFQAAVDMPIGLLSYGVKQFPFGTGSTLGYNTRTEVFLLVIPYGPFRFLPCLWLARGRLGTDEGWSTVPDKDTKNTVFHWYGVTYDQGALSAGAWACWRSSHSQNFELHNLAPTADWPIRGLVADYNQFMDLDEGFYAGYIKYNNGRFFAAAEYAWLQIDAHRAPTKAGNGAVPLGGYVDSWDVIPGNIAGLGDVPLYLEAYNFFAEVGAVAGPSKLRLMYAQSNGPVKNLANPTKRYLGWAVNYQALRPYQFLMFETYAGGNNGGWNQGSFVTYGGAPDAAFSSDDHGAISDAYAFAGRLDYAVACNLNIWASYIWAHRLEQAGTWRGQYLSTGAQASVIEARDFCVANGFPVGDALRPNSTGAMALRPLPSYVDDGYLGWEANVGIDWKLLEGMNMHVQYAYWQPGEWFDQAYQAIGLRGGDVVDNAVVVGRSPIQAIHGSFLINF